MFPHLSLGCLILRKRHTNNPPPPYTHQPTMEQKLHRAWQQMKLKQNKSKTNSRHIKIDHAFYCPI